MILLVASFCIFTITAVLGLMIAVDIFRGRHPAPSASIVHGVSALLGSVFAISAALMGETRIYINIVMAVVIILLGVTAAVKRRKTGVAPKAILAVHILLAVVCYLLLGATALMGYDVMAMVGIEVPEIVL
ncbi:MAG: hypothetical protein GQ583_07555 [Methyloprofundus sp.]|nr:hypothetical protein [Methyloprofundus sp.]